MSSLVTAAEIAAAQARLAGLLEPTPVARSDYYSQRLGAEIFLKLEILQPTHTFKVRGNGNAVLALSPAERRSGLITASAGNHGLALAYTAARLGLPATVYLPGHAAPERIRLIEKYGARVVPFGNSWDEANREAMRLAAENGRAYIHPFADRAMMAGSATIVPELLDQLGSLDTIVVSVGGGGLIAGLIAAVQHHSPKTRVVGVETIGADSVAQSLRAGHLIELPAITSIAASLGARRPGAEQYEIVARYAAGVVTVSDGEALVALLDLLDEEKLLVEPAASCCLAALTLGKIAVRAGERVAVILCGATVTLGQVQAWQKQLL